MTPVEAPIATGVDSLRLLSLLESGPQEYHQTLDLQRTIHDEVVARLRPSTLLLLEHQPVFTAGKRTEPVERPLSTTPVVDVDRGGKITWHGPGQLIGYPILRLRNPQELVGYVREIEGGIIDLLADFGIVGGRVEGRSGVWIDGVRKIAAIGIRVAQGVTMHGFAINANCSLASFDEIVPCGINDAAVTSISKELGRDISVFDLLPKIQSKMVPILGALS
ncbi:MAG: lipoyl(octanoyl) transferase LipB [Actinomycetota bacterium]